MANTTPSPNMNMPVPTVGEDPGPDWATNIDASLSIVDSHNHSSGQGVQINPDGININTDLPFNENNATRLRTAKFTAQTAALALGTDVGCIYVVNNELYYNDENGTPVQITNNGSVNAGAGSISGLPSGTASASFAAGTFTWRSATNTPATMNTGPLVVGAAIANSKQVTIAPPNSLAANYSMTLPSGLPGSTSILNVDSSGNQGLVPSDNSTFGVAGGAYQVLDDGISTAKIADGAVTYTKLGPLNFNGSPFITSYILTSTTYVEIGGGGGLDGGITGTGRPIMILMTSAGGTNGEISTSAPGVSLEMAITRDGSVLTELLITLPTGTRIPPVWTYIDTVPGSGAHVYAIKGKVNSGSAFFTNISLYLQEL